MLLKEINIALWECINQKINVLLYTNRTNSSENMKSIELKADFHDLIDSIDNETLLSRIYELLKRKKDSKEGQLWKSLSIEDKQELILAMEESSDYGSLISQEEMSKKHKKWL